jgi:hypothetical protein
VLRQAVSAIRPAPAADNVRGVLVADHGTAACNRLALHEETDMTAELPGLPEPAIQADCDGECVHGPYYTADQMHAYATEALRAAYGRGEVSEFAVECLARYLCQRDGEDPDEVSLWEVGRPECPCWHTERDVARGILHSASLPPPPEALLGKEPK